LRSWCGAAGKRTSALLANFISSLAIVRGGLLAFNTAEKVDSALLLSFAAGNFIYIAAADLIPEVKHDRVLANNLVHFSAFSAGIGLSLLTRLLLFEG
jgi:zinc and cadmium transporter